MQTLTKAQRRAAKLAQPNIPAVQASASSVPALPTTVPGAVASPNVAIAPQATAVVAQATPSTALHPTQVVVGLGKPYNVRAGTQFDNVRSWQATVAYLQANGGSCTMGALAEHLKKLYNHANFAGYAVRRGYLAPVQAPVPQATAACLGL